MLFVLHAVAWQHALSSAEKEGGAHQASPLAARCGAMMRWREVTWVRVGRQAAGGGAAAARVDRRRQALVLGKLAACPPVAPGYACCSPRSKHMTCCQVKSLVRAPFTRPPHPCALGRQRGHGGVEEAGGRRRMRHLCDPLAYLTCVLCGLTNLRLVRPN